MGVYNEYCVVCGGPPHFVHDKVYVDGVHDVRSKAELAALAAFDERAQWMNHWSGFTEEGSVLPLGEYRDHGYFDCLTGGEFYLHTSSFYGNTPPGAPRGVAAHTACAELRSRELGYRLRAADIKVRRGLSHRNMCSGINYGKITKYQNQDFDQIGLFRAGLGWMLHDPTEDERSRERILKMWTVWVQNHRAPRPDKKTAAKTTTMKTARKTVAEKTAARKTAVTKTTTMKSVTKTTATKTTATKMAAVKTAATKTTATKTAATKTATTKTAATAPEKTAARKPVPVKAETPAKKALKTLAKGPTKKPVKAPAKKARR